MQLQSKVRDILTLIGEDVDREGLKDTPRRVANMYGELFYGYDPSREPIVTTFLNGHDGFKVDEMIIDTGTYYSMCEHHMMPFFGTYIFGYIPAPEGSVLGLSKVARVVDFYSAKLQIQERLTERILLHLWDKTTYKATAPLAMGLTMTGKHLCKSMRGVKKEGVMTTTKLMGKMKTNIEVRNEFLNYKI